MENVIRNGIALILFLGIGAQWLAWRLGVPSILFLVTVGFVAGPLLGIIQPDQILGDLLFPVVSISVAILVFEGALNLRFNDLRKTGAVVRNLLSIGILATWFICSLAAHILLELELTFALLIGAVLTVTGPTVINPLLRSLRVSPKLSTILRWEGIIIDPIGAILAVLVYESFFHSVTGPVLGSTLWIIVKVVLVGSLTGFLAAWILLQLLHYEIIPEFLQNPSTLMILITTFTLTNEIQQEAGLLTATVMGLDMANQKRVAINKITEFKETLQILLIASLFVLLSARSDIEVLTNIDMRIVYFVLAVIFVARPVSVFLSAIGTKLNWRELVFLSTIAPRGIVAAAVSSLLALELSQAGYHQSDFLVSIIFIVIVVTGITSTAFSKPLAYFLGLHVDEPRGLLFLGAHTWACELAKVLKECDIPVQLVDTNPQNAYLARMDKLHVHYLNILEEGALLRIDMSQVGALLTFTSNDEVNSLAALSFQEVLGKKNIYQLQAYPLDAKENQKVSAHKNLRGKQLFSEELSYTQITDFYLKGWRFHATRITDDFSYRNLMRYYSNNIYPLMIIGDGAVQIYDVQNRPVPQAGQHLISLCYEDE